jgi:general stress protein 26
MPVQENQAGRPHMPMGYGISTDNEGLISWSWVDEQITKSRNYWICTTYPDGRPHVTPVWAVWIEGVLYFSCDGESRKARNIARNPQIAVHLESGDEVVILEGVAEKFTDKALIKHFSDVYVAKYPPHRPDDIPTGVNFVFKPQAVLAWLERDFPKTATRWQLGKT